MNLIFGMIRMGVVAFLLLCAFFLVAVGHVTTIRREGIRLANWLIIPIVWAAARVFRITMLCPEPDRLRTHQGLLLANHQSYLDILLTNAFYPVRYLAAIEVRQRPVLGWLSEAVGSVFIERGDIKSGRSVKGQLAEALKSDPQPPIVIFPEGRLGDGYTLFNFRRGTFRIAAENEIPYLLCAIKYDKPEITTWHGRHGESMIQAVWRLATYGKPIRAELIPLETIYPKSSQHAQTLAVQARSIIAEGLGIEKEKVKKMKISPQSTVKSPRSISEVTDFGPRT
ncbi:MAG: 1-acyl-sn-glycerol-3-phosphate acyltransferase [Chloroflexota bacterium]